MPFVPFTSKSYSCITTWQFCHNDEVWDSLDKAIQEFPDKTQSAADRCEQEHWLQCPSAQEQKPLDSAHTGAAHGSHWPTWAQAGGQKYPHCAPVCRWCSVFYGKESCLTLPWKTIVWKPQCLPDHDGKIELILFHHLILQQMIWFL